MSDRKNLIADRMEARLRAVMEAVPPVEPACQFWLYSDAGTSYCRKCAIAARAAELGIETAPEDKRSYLRTDEEDEFFEGIDGGFDTNSDSSASCETCGETLSYILTDEGVCQELDYWLENALVDVRPEDTYALYRLALNIYEGSPVAMLVGVSAAVNQAWRLLFGDAA